MSFEWREFLDRRGIVYKTAGRDELRLACPWCNDGKQHLALNTAGKGWHCWIGGSHRGVSPVRLIARLTNCSFEEAARIAGVRFQAFDNEIQDIGEKVAALLGAGNLTKCQESEPRTAIQLPSDFRPLRDTPMAQPFIDYLIRRGFARDRIERLTQRYGLYYARHGKQRYRIVFTVTTEGQLRAWSGRTIANNDLRYLTSSAEDGAEPISNHLLFFDLLKGGKRLVVCEGPFDALKLWELGQPATCFFTARPSAVQTQLLLDVLPRYQQRFLLLDQGTINTAFGVQADMSTLGIKVAFLPAGVKDPGELRQREQLREIFDASR